ncbi:hypothetical protein JZU56_06170, partial [bacterium]|nr:hypothetical protein [bacterium]
MCEEHSGEDGLLVEVIEGEGEKQKITAKAVKARLKEILAMDGLMSREAGMPEATADPDCAQERETLQACAALLDQQT